MLTSRKVPLYKRADKQGQPVPEEGKVIMLASSVEAPVKISDNSLKLYFSRLSLTSTPKELLMAVRYKCISKS